MAVALNITSIDNTNNHFEVHATLTLTGNYGGGATHGDTINLAAANINIPSSRPCRFAIIREHPAAGTAPTGYNFIFCTGTTQANGLLSITNNLTEYTQGSAYSAGLLAAVVKAIFYFPSI